MVITDTRRGPPRSADRRARGPPASHAHEGQGANPARAAATISAAAQPRAAKRTRCRATPRHRGPIGVAAGACRDAGRRARAGPARRPAASTRAGRRTGRVRDTASRVAQRRHHRGIAGHQRGHLASRRRSSANGKAPATSARPPVLTSGKLGRNRRAPAFSARAPAEPVDHGLGDEADALRSSAEARGVGFGILADDEAFGDLHAAVDDDIVSRARRRRHVGQHHRTPIGSRNGCAPREHQRRRTTRRRRCSRPRRGRRSPCRGGLPRRGRTWPAA